MGIINKNKMFPVHSVVVVQIPPPTRICLPPWVCVDITLRYSTTNSYVRLIDLRYTMKNRVVEITQCGHRPGTGRRYYKDQVMPLPYISLSWYIVAPRDCLRSWSQLVITTAGMSPVSWCHICPDRDSDSDSASIVWFELCFVIAPDAFFSDSVQMWF